MTNISAIKSTKKGKETIFFVADGMSTNLTYSSKYDNAHKLHKVGNFLVAGTGDGNKCGEVYDKLSREKFENVTKVAKSILEITDKMGLNEKEILNFITAGKNENNLNILTVNTTGSNTITNGTADYKKRGFVFSDKVSLEGSGSRFGTEFLRAQNIVGKPTLIEDNIENLILTYELAKAGSNDSGVNEKLQLGIITTKTTKTLYHPDITLTPEIYFENHIKEFAEKKTSLSNIKDDERTSNLKTKKTKIILPLIEEFYHAFTTDLNSASELKRSYTYETERYALGIIGINRIKLYAKERQNIKKSISKGYKALLSDRVEDKINYIADFQQRQKNNYSKLIK